MISVIACTNRGDFIKNIIRNFVKQTIVEKELILILNSSRIILDHNVLNGIRSKILRLPEETNLGECLNEGVAAASYPIISKMDDDDYYGPGYLQEAFDSLKENGAELVGKSSFYIYFNKNHELRLYNPNHENEWIYTNAQYRNRSENFLHGATLVFNKNLFNQVAFPPINIGEDYVFQQLCLKNQIKMYSLSSEHYVYFRYENLQHHTSDVRESILRSRSRFVKNTLSVDRFMERRER